MRIASSGGKSNCAMSKLIHSMILLGVLLLPAPSIAGLLNSVPKIQGTITDATSDMPISNAVLVVRWKKTIYGFFHPQSVIMKKIQVATDMNGVFRIPAYSSMHIFSRFDGVIWVVRHPLYSTINGGLGHENVDAIIHSKAKQDETVSKLYSSASLSQSGEIVLSFSLHSLKTKFKDSPSIKTDFHGELYSEFTSHGPIYFSIAKYLGLPVSTDAVFREWDEIAGRFPDVEYVQSSLKSGKERIAEELMREGPVWDE